MLEPPDVGTVSLHLSPFDVFFPWQTEISRQNQNQNVSHGRFSAVWCSLLCEVLGIIMVGTGVLMSQLLVEYVLDTSQDLDKRLWVYVLCLHFLDGIVCTLFPHFGFHMLFKFSHFTCSLVNNVNMITGSWCACGMFAFEEYYGTALKATYSVFEATFSGSWPLLARNLIRDVSEWCLSCTFFYFAIPAM